MKKVIVILIAALLVLPLFSRGVTENVANEGIKGVATYLDSLDRVENDERIPEEVRKEISHEVYRGRNLDEAVSEYLQNEEAERLLKEAEEARLRREAEAERIRKEYEAERQRKAEEAERLRREAEERIRIEKETEEFEREEAERKASTPVFEGTLEYRGISSDVVLYRTYATVTIPQGMSDDDFASLLDAVCTEYTEETANVTYDIEGYTLELYYPEQSQEFLLSALDTLSKYAEALIDLMYAAEEELTATMETAEAVEESGPVVYDSGLVIESDGTIRTFYTYRDTLTASVVVEENRATVSYPSLMIRRDEIDTFMVLFCEEFGEYVSAVYYDVPEDGKIVIDFDGDYVGGTYYRLAVLSELEEIVSDYIDTLAVAPIAEEKSSSEEQVVRSFMGIFDYRGINAQFTVTETDAIIVLPEGVTENDVTSLRETLIEKYPEETLLVRYELDEGSVLIHYPKQNIDYLMRVCEVVGDEAAFLIDRVIEENLEKPVEAEKVETAPSETEKVVKEDVSESAYEDVKEETPPEEAEETAEAVSETPPLGEPAAVTKKSFVTYNFDITLGLRGKMRYYRGDDHLYPSLEASMRAAFADFFYIEAGVDVFGYMKDSTLYIVGSVNTSAGLDIRLGFFDLFGYAEADYLFTSKNSSFKNGMQYAFGAGLDWRITEKFIIGGGYEYQSGNHMFNAWVKFRF